jgi:hypothetical protein
MPKIIRTRCGNVMIVDKILNKKKMNLFKKIFAKISWILFENKSCMPKEFGGF